MSWKEHLKEIAGAVGDVIYSDTMQQKVAQGAAELSQALNSQANSYVPYGAGQAPLEVEGPGTAWQQQLKDASHGAGKDQDHGMEM
jgi:hypothetical protein